MNDIRRVFIANRGEIAVRVLNACRQVGLEVVVGHSSADRLSAAVEQADRRICLGPAPSKKSYLLIPTIIHAALAAGCQAIHPGYGFLSENAEFAQACVDAGLVFIGPRPDTIRLMGNKLRARAAAEEAQVPLLPGSEGIGDFAEARDITRRIGFPVLIKAAAGGGGRGMKIAASLESLDEAISLARSEAGAAFGDSTIYIERYVANARHIEVQVMGDRHGNLVHLGERDCSMQRRHQKVVEEAPASSVAPGVLASLHAAAVALCKRVRYESAGTVEFIVDQDTGDFYFLEMNTRIQVEHPVTEMTTGIDLVAEQIRVAQGHPLSFSQRDVRSRGHAIEVRITAESAEKGFRPAPGTITTWDPPRGDHIRVDTHCFAGYAVPPFYDSLLGKLIVGGATRAEAVDNLSVALRDFQVEGLPTTIPFLRTVVGQGAFKAGAINTVWLEKFLKQEFPES